MQPLKRMKRGIPDALEGCQVLFSEKQRYRKVYKFQIPPCVHACAYGCLYVHMSD